MNACSPAFIDAGDDAEEVPLDDAAAVEVEELEELAAVGSTEATATVVDAGVVEVVVEVDEVLEDAAAEVVEGAAAEVVDEVLLDAVDDVLSGTAGVGGASKRINNAKLMVSGLLSDTVLSLLIVSTVLTVSSGSGLGAH
jgi:hypothetical protein